MNNRMKCLVTDGRNGLSIREVTIPEISPYKALVRMKSCGICNGTDNKIISGSFKNIHQYPAILGHEGVGEVVEKGAKVRYLDIGELVLLPFIEKPIDGYYSAWGAFSEFGVVCDGRSMSEDGISPGHPDYSEAYLAQLPIPEGMDAVNGCMLITFREVLSGCHRFGFSKDSSLVVFGAGPVGCCFIRMARLLGMGPIIAFDVDDEKVEKAKRMGADYAFNSTGESVERSVRSICPDGVDFALDAVGLNTLVNLSMKLVKNNGKICCYGISPKLDMQIDWKDAPYNWDLHFHQFPSKLEEGRCHEQICSWVKEKQLNPADFISDVYPFDRIMEAFEVVNHKKAKGKIVITFG